MNGERVFSLRNPWFTSAVGATVLIAVLSAAAGFLWFPSLEAKAVPGALWDMICSAAGIGRAAPPSTPASPVITTSAVIVTPQTLSNPSAVSIGRGATLALQCAICHGARGLSQADTPNLAGQYAASIYKELQDFKSGARTNAVMSPQAVNLTDEEMQDVAAYYAFLPRLAAASGRAEPEIVAQGAPMRNIPPCGACHGGIDVKAGSPWLQGASENYLKAQLQAFADGTRHNDISEQMRNVARRMTPAEIDAAARYFSKVPE
ncbi:MAG: cytochrome c4 [Alphaproteobacteria bacterium]|nr:cytochrome c4 [Alphaproteobacteria bacterium]